MTLGEQGVLKRAIHAGTWSVLGLIAQKVIGLGSFFILARLLTPQDYGVITVVLMVAGVLDTLSTPGFERALIQKQGEVSPYLNAFWTFNLFRSLALCAVIFLLAPTIAAFFNLSDPLALMVLRAAGLLMVIQSLGNLGNLFFFKDLSFKKVFLRDVGGQVAFSAVAFGYALYSPTVLALFYGFLAQNIASVAVQYHLHPHRPRLSFSFRRLADLAWYGGYVMAQNILNQLNSILENVAVGRMLGIAHLGLYSRAVSIASLPSSAITSVVNKVGFPAYALIQESMEKAADGFRKSFDIALSLMAPFVALLLFEGTRLVDIFLGTKWLPMVSAMQVLVLSFFLKGLIALLYPLIEGVGRVDARFKLSLVQSLLLFSLLFVLVPEGGIQGAAVATLITFGAVGFVALYWTKRNLPFKLSDLLPSLSIVACSVSIAVMAGIPLYFFKEAIPDVWFVAYLVGLTLVYGVSLLIVGKVTGKGPYLTLRTILATFRR